MRQEKYGVLMVNLGTPEAPTPKAVKRYLAEFLSDRRVVDTPRALWLPLLYGVILPLRSPRVAKLYQSIWMAEGSPLLVYSRRQQQALAASLPDVAVELAMNYGQPALPQALARLIAQDITRLIILPLYPQYSCSTSAAIWDAVARSLKRYRRLPSISFIRDYAAHPAYIAALSARVAHVFARHGRPDRLVLSFHGILQRYAEEGDDYPQRCDVTRQALAAALDYPAEQVLMTFQSRFGRDPWLLPATDETMKSLPSQGVKRVQVICPGFAADCLETLEEIQVQNREIFEHAGGSAFHYIPALNDDAAHVEMLRQLVMAELR
ncbi:Ferrochelatase protoheme ferro-lyase [Candidatus Sodalis pierantonius str. SOPE]|uniref:Ferrochelatase n=1 Tax=Candidatus Sodalis pierantonii str. SOPE TaxID=2342 RepID=W0HSB9_9GAMM|nr:ferrochelatase [Candidatus Sodalis pierantonius]AHF75028.1 Ferrochelatase protoheme ferro-lyase [Candidatus Sodalis pierantonius str. SOPE]